MLYRGFQYLEVIYIHNSQSGPTQKSVIERLLLVGEFAMRGSTVSPVHVMSMCTYVRMYIQSDLTYPHTYVSVLCEIADKVGETG